VAWNRNGYQYRNAMSKSYRHISWRKYESHRKWLEIIATAKMAWLANIKQCNSVWLAQHSIGMASENGGYQRGAA
jgi:hypothetical protein